MESPRNARRSRRVDAFSRGRSQRHGSSSSLIQALLFHDDQRQPLLSGTLVHVSRRLESRLCCPSLDVCRPRCLTGIVSGLPRVSWPSTIARRFYQRSATRDLPSPCIFKRGSFWMSNAVREPFCTVSHGDFCSANRPASCIFELKSFRIRRERKRRKSCRSPTCGPPALPSAFSNVQPLIKFCNQSEAIPL